MSVQRVPPADGRRGFLRVRWIEEGRHRSKSFPDTRHGERDAHAFDKQMQERGEHGAFAPVTPSALPLREWLIRWVEVHGVAWAASTIRQRCSMIDHDIAPHLGDVRLRDLGTARVRTWRRDLIVAGASGATVNSATRVLSAALGAAVGEGLLPGNPCRGIRPVPQEPTTRQAMPVPLLEAIRGALPGDRDRLILALLCYAGLRPGEAIEFRAGDVADGGIVVSRARAEGGGVKAPKAGRTRVVPLRRELVRDLPDDLRDQPQDQRLVSGERGGPLDWHNWTTRVWRPVVRGLGVRHVPYEGRHTFASLSIAEGCSVVELAAWMGHASTKMTLDTYSHLFSLRDHGGHSSS